MMNATYRKEISLKGHRLDVLKSALQKYIRRGDVEGALYCAGELDLFSDVGDKRIRTNLIHRLMIIFIEDVGLGGFSLWKHQIAPLVRVWLSDRSQVGVLQEIVRILCKAPKTRACSFARAFAKNKESWEGHKDWEKIQKIRLESETISFKKALETKSWSSIIILVNSVEADYPLEVYKTYLKEMGDAGVRNIPIAYEWIREIKGAERPLILLLPLLAFLFLERETVPVPKVNFDEIKGDWNEHRLLPRREFEDFVFDKHVKGGNRNREFWLETSSSVENEIFIVPNVFRDIYFGKKNTQKEEKYELETSYELVARCQLVCTSFKTDTVMAIKNEEFVFMKGPYVDDKIPSKFILLQELKKKKEMPYVKARIEYLIPNRWESTPIGIRNRLDKNKVYPFLICKSLFPIEQMKTKIQKSEKWPETEVMDAKVMGLTINPFKLKKEELLEYVEAIKFRVEHNLGDLADRNFVKASDGHIYSVDEEVYGKKIDLESALKKKRFELVKPFL